MALRRLAQANNAAAAVNSSPRPANSVPNSPGTPITSALPSTPRNRASMGVYRSPTAAPSVSSSVPFDWDAAKSRRPPPYATPPQRRGRKSMGVATATPTRRVVRKKGFFEKIASIPSAIALEIALFPNNLPLPTPKTSARVIGGLFHFLHLCVRMSQSNKLRDSDIGWEDMYREGGGESWFDWTVPVSFIIIAGSCLNAIYLFTRIKLYRLHHRPDLVGSPHANFVAAHMDFEPLQPPSLFSRIRSASWRAFISFWRFLLGLGSPGSPSMHPGRTSRVQQLEVWSPGELELVLFSVYSPAHAVLWMATGPSNWMLLLVVMVLVGIQLNVMTQSYTLLLKDREILAAEVMNEYNLTFVNPRINPIRRDVAVMTHQAEVVNVWED